MSKQTKESRNYVHKVNLSIGSATKTVNWMRNFIDVDKNLKFHFQVAKGREQEEGKKITTFKTFKVVGQIIFGL